MTLYAKIGARSLEFDSSICSILHRTIVGIRGKDGVVFGVEKLVLSKLYEYGANKRIMHIDNHIGMVRCWSNDFQKKNVV